jgi:DNA-binding MarR family transcriptional regulator
MRKLDLIRKVVRGERENNIGAVMFHQAVGQGLGINVTDMKCLDIIALRGSASPSQLAALTGLTSGSTTAMLDRLEKRRLIARRRNPGDRRSRTVVLTKRAMRSLPLIFASMAKAMEKLASSYSEAELRTLSDFFSKTKTLWEEERSRLQWRVGHKWRQHAQRGRR